MKPKRIKQIRLDLDLTQVELGRLVGLSDQMIARYEKGRNKPSGSFVRLLALLLEEHIRGHVYNIYEFLESCR